MWHDGQLWLATTGGGLVRLRPRVVQVVEAPAAVSPIAARLQWDAATGSVWARSLDDQWWSVSDPPARVEPPGLHAPAEDLETIDAKSLPIAPPPWDDAVRWWATERELRREAADGTLTPLAGPRGFWQAHDALLLPDGSLLVTTNDGLWRLRRDRATPVTAPDGSSVAVVRSLALLDADTVVLAGSDRAEVGVVDLRSDRALLAAVGSSVRHVRTDAAWVWLSTEQRGLCAVSRRAAQAAGLLAPDTWRCLDETHGLGSPGVHASAPDGAGRVWLSANRGLGVVSAATLKDFAAGARDGVGVVWLGTDAGMLAAEANGAVGGAMVEASDGSVYFPTQRGVARVRPDRYVEPPEPHVVLDAVEVDGERVAGASGGVDLPAEARLVELRWAPVSLAAAGGVRIRHRLSGDPGWSAPTSDRTLQLRGLGPGAHSLQVQAGIGDRWGPVLSVDLYRPPRLTERVELWAGAVLCLLLWALLAFAVQRRRARAHAEELQDLVDAATGALRQARDALAADNVTLARRTAELGERNAELDDKNARLAAQEARLQALVREKAARARQLEDLDRLKRALVANISHELRTPLTLIRGPLDVLAGGESDPARRAELALAARNAARLDGLVSDLLLLSRAESGALPLRAQRLTLSGLLGRVLDRFTAARLRCAPLPPDSPDGLWGDPAILDTAIGNLVANALEHGVDDAPAEISAHLESIDGVPGVRVRVRDHGPGVPEAARAALFHRFERGAAEGGGLGLGLALSRELVELHGGVLDHLAPEDGGACFRVWLPLGSDHLAVEDIDLDAVAPAPAPSDPAPAPPPTDNAEPTVLLVEDNDELRAFLAAQLGTRRRVEAVGDAEAALAWLAGHTPRVVVSDIMLPGRSGLDLARTLRADPRTAALPVLLVSARGQIGDRVEGLEVADDYLPKPFSVLELHARVEALVRRGGQVVAPDPAAPEPEAAPASPEAEATDPRWLVALAAALDAHVDAHLADPDLDAPALARAVAMSQRTLSQRLRAAGWPSPAAWIRERRLDRAREMLETGAFETVGEVAAAVGMSRSYFTRAFKARMGVAPGDRAQTVSRAAPSDDPSPPGSGRVGSRGAVGRRARRRRLVDPRPRPRAAGARPGPPGPACPRRPRRPRQSMASMTNAHAGPWWPGS